MAYVKFQKYKKQVSFDQGETWEDVVPEEYAPSGDPLGYYDTYEDCIAIYRTVHSGTTCVGVDMHVLDVYEVSYDNGVTWEVYSTSAGTLIERNSYDCGYRTRTISGDPYCNGYDKYEDVYSQVSTDYGSTWTTTATTHVLIEADSPDCGYIPNYKYKLTLSDSSTVSAECNATSAITQAEISAYTSTLVNAEIGWCITSIGRSAFYQCSGLTNCAIGNNVTSIGDYAFNQCRNLTGVTMSSGVTTIGANAFYQCNGLTTINIPSGVTSIGAWAFYYCSSLTSVTIPSGITIIDNSVFRSCRSLSSVVIPDNITTIGVNAFDSCTGLTSVTIPDSVTSIGGNAFYYTPWWSSYSADTSHHYGNIVYINDVAYKAVNTGVTSVAFKNDTKGIGGDAFENCSGITSVDIPDSVTNIGTYAFADCSGLTSITIPSNVVSIGSNVFRDCSNLSSVTVNATTPPSLGGYAFYNTSNCPIYVPSASVNAYKSASGWSSYSSRIQAIP